MSKLHRPMVSSCLKACSVYSISWLVGLLLAWRFVSPHVAQHLVAHPTFQQNAWHYISHNLELETIFFFGTLTLGVSTFLLLFFNGLVVGLFTAALGLHYGLVPVCLGLLPHGIPESLAWILLGGCSFFVSYRMRAYFFQPKKASCIEDMPVIGDMPSWNSQIVFFGRKVLLGNLSWKFFGSLLAVATLLIIVAGFIEASVSTHFVMAWQR